MNQANGELVAGVEEQTRQALVNMGRLLQVNMVNIVTMVSMVNMVNMGHLLQAAGCDHRHVVKTTVLLKDIKDFPAVNAVYAEFFREDPPARATFQVTFLHLFYLTNCVNWKL